MNKLLSSERLQSSLELIAQGVTRPTKIAAAIGVAYRTYCSWMVRSNGGDPNFIVTYNDQDMQWARAITLATRLAGVELRGMLLQEGIYGYDEIQTKDGQIVWALDPAACALPEEDREWLGYRKDGLLERDGKLVPVTIRRKAPFAQQIRMLEAMFPDLRPTSTVNSNVNIKGMVGVGIAKPVDYSATPVIPPPPPIPIAPPVSEEADFAELDPELDDLLNGPPEENLIDNVPVPANLGPQPPPVAVEINITLPEPEPDTPVPAPLAPMEAPRRAPRNPLEADLFARVEAARSKPKGGDTANG
jgi:hypothetical protein